MSTSHVDARGPVPTRDPDAAERDLAEHGGA